MSATKFHTHTGQRANLYLAYSLAAAVSEPALYRLLTFHIPKKMSLFLLRDTYPRNTPPRRRSERGSSLPPDCFVSRGSISPCEYFLTMSFSRGGVVSTSPKPQAGGPPLVGCPRLLIQYISSYPPYQRPFLHPQPEDAPCRGDRDPLIKALLLHVPNISVEPRLIWYFSSSPSLSGVSSSRCTAAANELPVQAVGYRSINMEPL